MQLSVDFKVSSAWRNVFAAFLTFVAGGGAVAGANSCAGVKPEVRAGDPTKGPDPGCVQVNIRAQAGAEVLATAPGGASLRQQPDGTWAPIQGGAVTAKAWQLCLRPVEGPRPPPGASDWVPPTKGPSPEAGSP